MICCLQNFPWNTLYALIILLLYIFFTERYYSFLERLICLLRSVVACIALLATPTGRQVLRLWPFLVKDMGPLLADVDRKSKLHTQLMNRACRQLKLCLFPPAGCMLGGQCCWWYEHCIQDSRVPGDSALYLGHQDRWTYRNSRLAIAAKSYFCLHTSALMNAV